jgi:hypothetical protein
LRIVAIGKAEIQEASMNFVAQAAPPAAERAALTGTGNRGS